MEFINLERLFKIEVVASVVENRVLTKNTDEITDFCSFITGEDVNFGNIYRFQPTIVNILNEQYPDMQRILPYPSYGELIQSRVENIISVYKAKYGNEILIKSLKKDITNPVKKHVKFLSKFKRK